MKKHFTLLVLLATVVAQNLFAGGPSAPARFDSTFAQNGFLIDTLSGGGSGAFIQYNEILVGNNQDFWIAGTANTTYLAAKYSVNGVPVTARLGSDLTQGSGQTGVISNNKIYLGGGANNGGHYQNMAFNFDGTNNSIFHQTVAADSFLSEAIYAQGKPVGDTRSNCSAVLANGHIVTAVINYFDSTYITEFNPVAGTTVTTYPQITDGSNLYRLKALRTLPATNSYVLMFHNTSTNYTVIVKMTSGAVDVSYAFSGQYNAMIAIDATHLLIGGDNLSLFDITTGSYSALPASLTGVLQLTRNTQTGEIYAFNGAAVYALTPSYNFDLNYNPDGLGSSFNYAPVNADYWLGAPSNSVPSSTLFFTDMEMQGNNILISGYTTTLNNQPASSGQAGFVIKVKGKKNFCDDFSVVLDSVYGTSGCDWNAHISLTGQFPINAAFSWSSGGGSFTSITASPFVPGGLCPETYTVVFTDGHGCTDTVNFVTPVPTPCVAPVIHNQLAATNAMCEGETGQVGPVSVTGSLYTHQWYKNGVAVQGAIYATFTAPQLTAADTGDYYVIVTNGCGADTSNVSHLGMIPSTTPTIQQTGDLLTAVGYADGATFQWYFNGSSISGATSATYTATQSGNYSVAAINQMTCTKLSADVNVTVTGITNVSSNNNIRIYPNPANEYLLITCDEQMETTEVYNVTGQQVIFIKGQITKLNTAPLAAGVYTLRIKNSNGNTAVKKFIKQ